jgi:hypothetical protein
MQVISEAPGLPRLRDAQIALLRASHAYGGIFDALARHIVDSMGNLDEHEPAVVAAEEVETSSMSLATSGAKITGSFRRRPESIFRQSA